MCHRVQGDSVTKRQPLLCVVGVVTSCMPCARVRTPRSCAPENTCTNNQSTAKKSHCVNTIRSHREKKKEKKENTETKKARRRHAISTFS